MAGAPLPLVPEPARGLPPSEQVPTRAGARDAAGPSAPSRPGDYAERLSRKQHARSRPGDDFWLMERGLLASLRRASEKYARGRLLDVGCGGRPYHSLFASQVTRYVGVDTPACEGARPDAAALAEALPFRDAAFDTVLCTEVIEHLAEPGAAVRELARVLGPGGHLILTTPQMWPLHEEPFDFYRFTRHGLAHLCRAAGLEVMEIQPHGGPWATVGIVLIMHGGEGLRAAMRRLGSRSSGGALWPLKLPLLALYRAWVLVVNLVFGTLDRASGPGRFVLGHTVVAQKPHA